MTSMEINKEEVPINYETIKEALAILQKGDERVPQADRFLARARASSEIWHVIPTLLSIPSQFSLIFASHALYTRLRSDWLILDNEERMSAVSLAVTGITSPSIRFQSGTNPNPVVYYFAKVLGFAFSVSTPQVQQLMWGPLISKLQDDKPLKCNVMAALATEMDQNATLQSINPTQIRAFCHMKAQEVIPDAILVLDSFRPNKPLSEEHFYHLRVAVQCLQPWIPYSNKAQVATALLRVIILPQLADLVAEALSEIVGYSATSQQLLLNTAQGLTEAFHTAQGPNANVVHHAIAEVACLLSESNADELMELQTEQSKVVVHAVLALLWLGINSPDDPSFFAAIEGWMSWIAADHLMTSENAKIGNERICAVLRAVVLRMESLPFIQTHFSSDIENENLLEGRAPVIDLLLTGSLSIGHENYISLISKYLIHFDTAQPSTVLASLEALGANVGPGESTEMSPSALGEIRGVLNSVLRIAESGTHTIQNGQFRQPGTLAIQRSAFRALASYSSMLSETEELFYRTASCANTALREKELAGKAAFLLWSLTKRRSFSLVRYLKELISTLNDSLFTMSIGAAENATRAVACVIDRLPSHKRRLDALEDVVRRPCERLSMSVNDVAENNNWNESVLFRDLTILNAATGICTDSDAVRFIFHRMSGVVFQIARKYCGNGPISKTTCSLFEVVVQSVDDRGGSDDRPPQADERSLLVLTIEIARVVSQCFKGSGPDGENVWLKTMNRLIPDLVAGIEDAPGSLEEQALNCVRECVEAGLSGLNQFSSGDYNTQPEMTKYFFQLLTAVTKGASKAVSPIASEISVTAMKAIKCTDVASVKACLGFWKCLFSRKGAAEPQQTMLNAAGGPKDIAAGVLCAARIHRCASDVADVLFAMCRKIAGEMDAEQMLRECLNAAFRVEAVPKEGLSHNVREMLFRGCYASVGNKKEFRRALDEFGRVCEMTVVMMH